MGDVAVERVRGAALAYTVVAGPSRDAAWFVWGHGLTSSMAREDEFGLVDPAAVARVTNVLRYDARGHGSSDSTADLDAYHWRQLAEDQLALTSALGIDRYVAGGASMGCATALYAALAAPDRIAGLVLAIPPTAWETRAAQRDAYELTAALVAAGNVEVVIEGARALPPPDPLVDVAAWRDGTERTLRVTDPSRLERIFAGAAAANLPSRGLLATIDLPALILAWTGDAGHPVSTARELAAVLPEARLVTATTLDDLATWTERVVEFLTPLIRPRGPDS